MRFRSADYKTKSMISQAARRAERAAAHAPRRLVFSLCEGHVALTVRGCESSARDVEVDEPMHRLGMADERARFIAQLAKPRRISRHVEHWPLQGR
eukprot:3626007-Pleurochrysis_carterae.AAC.1